jgi:hypothetical protein
MIAFEYKLSGSSIVRSDTIEDLGAFLDSKLYFHQHVDYISLPGFKLLGLIRSITS